MIDEITKNFPQEMIYEREKYLVKSLIDCAGFYYEFNLTKDLLRSEPLHIVDGEPHYLTDMIHKPLVTFTNFMMFWAGRVFPEDKPAFLKMADVKYIMGLYLNGNERISHSFWVMDSFGKPMLAENNMLLYKDIATGDVLGIGYTKDLYEFDAAKQRERRAQHVANTDPLTQCYNRRKLESYVEEQLAKPDGKGAFIIADLDCFKAVNDTMGHAYGDTFLMEFANYIKNVFKDAEMVARLGGDEFVVFLSDVDNKEFLQKKLKELIDGGRKVITTLDGGELVVSLSAGVAMYPENGTTYETLYTKADEALYLSKRLGKNKYFFYDEIGEYADITIPELIQDVELVEANKNKNFECLAIINSMYNVAIYVMDEAEHKILFYNKHLKEMCPQIRLGMICSKMWNNECDNCPLPLIGERGFSRQIIYFKLRGLWMDVFATRIMWKNKIPAFVVRAQPHFNQYEEGIDDYVK